jgi:hypothetical protein
VLRLLLLPRTSEELFPLVRRRKLKLDLRGPAWSELVDWATDGRPEGSGEPSWWAKVLGGLGDRSSMVVAMVGGGRALNISGCDFARVILAMEDCSSVADSLAGSGYPAHGTAIRTSQRPSASEIEGGAAGGCRKVSTCSNAHLDGACG